MRAPRRPAARGDHNRSIVLPACAKIALVVVVEAAARLCYCFVSREIPSRYPVRGPGPRTGLGSWPCRPGPYTVWDRSSYSARYGTSLIITTFFVSKHFRFVILKNIVFYTILVYFETNSIMSILPVTLFASDICDACLSLVSHVVLNSHSVKSKFNSITHY